MNEPETPNRVRSSELVRCAFTESEAGHILSLIAGNEQTGEYTAPREQYWKRSERIKSKLLKCNVSPEIRCVGKGKVSECCGKLPDPTPEQAQCTHRKWMASEPKPRHCLECGLQMWDAGD